MAEAFLLNRRLWVLNVSGNGLNEDRLEDLLAVLPQTGIQALDLSHNFLGDTGARVLLKDLHLTQIVSLKVKSNDIGPEVKAMSDGLRNANQEAITVEL